MKASSALQLFFTMSLTGLNKCKIFLCDKIGSCKIHIRDMIMQNELFVQKPRHQFGLVKNNTTTTNGCCLYLQWTILSAG